MGNKWIYENVSDISRIYDFEKTDVILWVWEVFIRKKSQRNLIGLCSFVLRCKETKLVPIRSLTLIRIHRPIDF